MMLQTGLETGTIYQGDCLAQMRAMKAGSVDLVFADPPFNIGYEYDLYDDRQNDQAYVAWSTDWMREVHRVLKPNGTFWLAIGDEFAAELKMAAQHDIGFTTRSWVLWYYTFGVNCKYKFSRSHAHLFHFVKDENNCTFNSEDPAVRIPSARALVYGDKRANPKGRLPDDTWILRPQDLHDTNDGFQPMDDTWYFARVAGTFKERKGFHGCQMPEQLLGRIVRVSSNQGDLVLDPFAGSGTTLAVAKKLEREWLGYELSAEYVKLATERLEAIRPGQNLDGPADPIASAPTTANGRRLDAKKPPKLEEPPKPTPVPSITAKPVKVDLRKLLRDTIVDAFFATHQGYSTDWLLADPDLQNRFHKACHVSGLLGGPADWNRELLRFRKTGKLPKRGELKRRHLSAEEMDAYRDAAEIAWRVTSQKFAQASLDEIFCDPQKSQFFDRTAERYAPNFPPASIRWAALRLRKAGKMLAEEVKELHFVFATRDFSRFQNWNRCRFDRFADQPGVYMLRGKNRQPLYVGETLDLAQRLTRHADCKTISGKILHLSIITPEEMPGEEYREPLKVDLVHRYEPSLNINLVGLRAGG